MARKNVSGSTQKEKGMAKREANRPDILIELVRSYDIFTNTISTSVDEFLITSEKIGHAFGLNCRGDLFEKRQKDFEDKLNDEEKQALDLFKGKSLTFVQDMVKDCPIETDQQKRTFKRAFALFIQKSFLLPTSSVYISPVHLPVIRDIDNTQGRNWAYMERYDANSLNDPNFPAPWIQRWTGELMKDKIKAEDEDITGLIQRAKMRAQQQKKGKKTDGEDEDQQDDADDTESNNEEEEYNSADDSETETDSEEVAAKPVHDATVAETSPKPGPQPQPGPEPEPQPEPQPQPDSEQVSEPQPRPDPEPVSGPQPQPEPKAVILFGPEPQEVIDGFVVAYQEVEETEAAIKACEEAELRYQQINQAKVEKDNEAEAEIRKIIEDVVTDTDKLPGRQEQAAPAPHKLDQPAPVLMMVASVAAQATEYDPSKAFDLGVRTTRQSEMLEMYDLDDFPEEPETPVTSAVPATTAVQAGPSSSEGHPHNRDLKERCVMWALSDRKDIKYDSIFMIHGDIHFEVITAYSLVMNNEPIPRFQSDVYILPPSALIFAPVIYSGHWWVYVLDKEKKTFFVVDSKRKDAPNNDRTRINKFAVNMIDQLLFYAGYHSLLTKGTRSKPPQISWFPRYQQIHEQPNAYDCGTFVMKWMEVLDPSKLDAHSRYPIEDWSTEDLQRFRNDIIWQIILSSQNLLIQKAIQGAIETTIHKPSAVLQIPYVQVNTDELKKLP
ncbi:hypothetical protein PIB30_069586 [Stylosanthes scabra]|uniref:Ubiquitin-like protease family profile domain-containing protein n=1 Tax=Stylosanthes scabra TaxID=79078 RepID=A0ABU6VM78_9FABA|nr:hypothetical protein [Stylosanthes scabra]